MDEMELVFLDDFWCDLSALSSRVNSVSVRWRQLQHTLFHMASPFRMQGLQPRKA
jgi:hypothetical protein